MAWTAIRERMYVAVHNAGYVDLQPTHVVLFRYPTIANMRPSQLAEDTGLSKQAVNDLLRHLEDRGYVQLKPDPSDRRARRITLTRRGKALMECVRKEANTISTEWAGIVGQKRFDAFRKTLVEFIDADRARKEAASRLSANQ
jgi:DNA-binding MarR family transcriptional regulator